MLVFDKKFEIKKLIVYSWDQVKQSMPNTTSKAEYAKHNK